jgi:hypothetical protein
MSNHQTAIWRRVKLERMAVPDSAGDFPSRVVRSVPLLPDGHSATTDGARLLSRLNTVRDVVSIVLPRSTAEVLRVWTVTETNR